MLELLELAGGDALFAAMHVGARGGRVRCGGGRGWCALFAGGAKGERCMLLSAWRRKHTLYSVPNGKNVAGTAGSPLKLGYGAPSS